MDSERTMMPVYRRVIRQWSLIVIRLWEGRRPCQSRLQPPVPSGVEATSRPNCLPRLLRLPGQLMRIRKPAVAAGAATIFDLFRISLVLVSCHEIEQGAGPPRYVSDKVSMQQNHFPLPHSRPRFKYYIDEIGIEIDVDLLVGRIDGPPATNGEAADALRTGTLRGRLRSA